MEVITIRSIMKDKAGVIDQLQSLVPALVAIGITLVIGFLIFAEVADNATVAADSNATTAIQEVQNATAAIPGWLPVVIIAVVGVLLMGLAKLFR